MKQVLIIAIWDNDDSNVFSKHIVVDSKTKPFKFKGKKPNKIIVPESLIDVKLKRQVKSLGCYGCNIVVAVGK